MINIHKVSIILPTYNVEKFLLQCLESIAAQTYKNIEVIIIIDGATDNSYEIAKNFCERDERFSVYWQENAGSGVARNNGLDRATGDYVIFVDPDDWCLPEYVENMVNLINGGEYDIVLTKEIVAYTKGKLISIKRQCIEKREIDNILDARKSYVDLLSQGLISAPHCKIYKLSIIKDNDVRFPDLRRSQDVVFNYRYYNFINKVLVSDYSGYVYRVLFKDRALRLPVDYYKTIRLLYTHIRDLHKTWGVPFDKTKACSDFYIGIQAHFESNVLRKEPIRDIIEDPVIFDIIQNAKPKKAHFILIRWLAIHKCYWIVSHLVLLLYYIKYFVH